MNIRILDPPKDICYVTLEDENKPEAILLPMAKGKTKGDS